MKSEAESRTIPWREGTWTDAVGAIRRELENSSPHSVVERLDASLADTTRARIRIQRLRALIQLVAEDPEGRRAEQEAERADFRGAATANLADGVPVLAASGKWEELREHPLFEALLKRVRAVTVEDVESIFDFERMAQCAKAFGMFLVTHSYVTGRYDDLWLGMRISNLFVEGQRTDGKGMFELCTVILQTLLHKPVVSASEAQARLPPIGRMLGLFELSEDLTRLLGPLAEEARSVTVESFRTEALWAHYGSSFGRMFTAYTSTGNPGYLEDLLILCSAEHSGETGRERTRRTNELALVLSELGRAFGGTSHFLAAEEIQRQVVSSIDRSDPSWIRYRANAAAYMLARLTSLSEPVLPSLEELRALLPPLPFDKSLAAAEGIGAAYSVRMQIEIAAALELLPPADEECLTLALDAAEISARLQDPLDTPSSGKGEIEAVAACTRALRAAKRKEPIADHDLNALTRMLAEPDRFPTVYDVAFTAAYEVIRAAPAARPSLRTSLLASAGTARPQAGEQLRRTLKIYVLLVELMIVDGEVSKDRERWGDIAMTAILLIQVAANVAWREPRRAPGGQSLRSATSQGRELALHFAREGATDLAAMLCQNSAAMLARDAVMRARPVPQLTDELLTKPLVAAQRGARLLLLTGRDEIAVLMREPQAEWRLESEHSNAAVERFADFPWMAETGVDQPFALDAWLTELAPVLDELIGEPLARLRSLTSDPILCLPTGVLATYPLALASRAETGGLAPLVIVPGPLADGLVESLLTPLPTRPAVSVIAGAAQLAGTGTIDVQRDLEAITGAGIEPSLIDSAGDDIDAKLDAADAIHFCGHLVPAGPDDTEFVFADGSLLPLSEVRSMRFERTRVVTLVSCSSGFWPSRAAEQVEHATGAFLEAGVGVVIASLWPIFDHPAFVFTETFYRCVGRGEPIATAYTMGIEAIRSYRPELLPYERPMHWAGLTLFAGNASWWGEIAYWSAVQAWADSLTITQEFAASGSSVGHLDDLIVVCAARQEGAGRQAEASRLNWLARFRYERGRILHSTDDFQAAVETQRMAVELLEESDPNRDGYRRSVVEYQLAEIAASNGSFRPLLASIRNDLPPLPPPSEIENEDEDETGAAYVIRALVELLAALEAAPAEWAELVADAFASAAVARRLLPPGKDQYDDELVEIEACARVLEAIHKNTEIAEKDLQTLAVAVAPPRFFTRSHIAAIRTLRTAIERSEPARHSLGVTVVDTDSGTRH